MPISPIRRASRSRRAKVASSPRARGVPSSTWVARAPRMPAPPRATTAPASPSERRHSGTTSPPRVAARRRRSLGRTGRSPGLPGRTTATRSTRTARCGRPFLARPARPRAARMSRSMPSASRVQASATTVSARWCPTSRHNPRRGPHPRSRWIDGPVRPGSPSAMPQWPSTAPSRGELWLARRIGLGQQRARRELDHVERLATGTERVEPPTPLHRDGRGS